VLSDLLTGPTLRELYEVRRILEPAATALAASRLTDEDFAAIDESLERMDAAETT
jgi:GntR family transcriptional regulator, transcriptional repressor for pyruvate dehydrogenase complex